MAAELIKSVLAAEAKGRQMEADAKKKAEKLIADAKIQADIIVKTSVSFFTGAKVYNFVRLNKFYLCKIGYS